MIDMLRDPLWQFIGAILTFLALPAAFWIYVLQRPRKELAYGVLSRQRLLSFSRELKGRVEVTVDGKPVEDVHLLVIGVKNSGNTPILQSDFLYVPSIRAATGTIFLSVEASTLTPSNLGLDLFFYPEKIEFNPILLNPGDYFSVQVLASSQDPEVSPDFRIIGSSNVERLLRFRPFSDRGNWVAFLFWLSILFLFIYIGILTDNLLKKFVYIGVPSIILLMVLSRFARSRFGAEASRYVDEI